MILNVYFVTFIYGGLNPFGRVISCLIQIHPSLLLVASDYSFEDLKYTWPFKNHEV
jgi:hypothetical protein